MYVCEYIYVYMCVFIYGYMYACVYIYVYIYICILYIVTIYIITDSFVLYLVSLIGLRRYMLFQSFYRDSLFLTL